MKLTMTEEMKKRLEEAAENFLLPYEKLYHPAIHLGFMQGVEQGYNEAIALAKEWLKNSFFQCQGDENIYWDCSYTDITEALEFFEDDMNKLWEGEK